jgi:adenylosuccinate lyase
LLQDPAFNMSYEELQKTMDPSLYTGRAGKQVSKFLTQVVQPILNENQDLLGVKAEIHV